MDACDWHWFACTEECRPPDTLYRLFPRSRQGRAGQDRARQNSPTLKSASFTGATPTVLFHIPILRVCHMTRNRLPDWLISTSPQLSSAQPLCQFCPINASYRCGKSRRREGWYTLPHLRQPHLSIFGVYRRLFTWQGVRHHHTSCLWILVTA